jgi:hypothetical protein
MANTGMRGKKTSGVILVSVRDAASSSVLRSVKSRETSLTQNTKRARSWQARIGELPARVYLRWPSWVKNEDEQSVGSPNCQVALQMQYRFGPPSDATERSPARPSFQPSPRCDHIHPRLATNPPGLIAQPIAFHPGQIQDFGAVPSYWVRQMAMMTEGHQGSSLIALKWLQPLHAHDPKRWGPRHFLGEGGFFFLRS